VLPELDAVIALTSGLEDMQAELNVVWKHLLPAFDAASTVGGDRLSEKLAGLVLSAPAGDAAPDPRIDGLKFDLEPGDSPLTAVSISTARGEDTVTLWLGDRVLSFGSGRDNWVHGEAETCGEMARIAAKGAWTTPTRFATRVASYETPFVHDLTVTFDEVASSAPGLELTIAQNVDLSGNPLRLRVRGCAPRVT
jgi:hypothetical protein